MGTLWAHTGSLDELDTDDLLTNLAERSLIRLDTVAGRTPRRAAASDCTTCCATSPSRLAGEAQTLHDTLLAAYGRRCADGWPSGPDDGYFFQNLRHHLRDSRTGRRIGRVAPGPPLAGGQERAPG